MKKSLPVTAKACPAPSKITSTVIKWRACFACRPCENGWTDRYAIGATWQIQLNESGVATMRPYVKLRWPFVTGREGTQIGRTLSGKLTPPGGFSSLMNCCARASFTAKIAPGRLFPRAQLHWDSGMCPRQRPACRESWTWKKRSSGDDAHIKRTGLSTQTDSAR